MVRTGIIPLRRDPLWPKSFPPERGQLIEQLRHTGHQHADGEGEDLVIQCISPTRASHSTLVIITTFRISAPSAGKKK